jgi:integrase
MLPKTLHRYRIRAQNFYQKHCDGTEAPDPAQICAALLACAQDYRPNSFTTLKSALIHDQVARGNPQAAERIRNLANPVTAPGSQLPHKPKPKHIRSVPFDDFKTLIKHLLDAGHKDELAALMLAHYLGSRPCEMRTISIDGNHIQIIGGKKNDKRDRGADRVLVVDRANQLRRIDWAVKHMATCPRSDAAIRDRLRLECRTLWPRRKRHPTLYSFRHQLGSSLKASGESAETLAYIMGHQSTESIEAYGDRRSGEGRKIHVRPAPGTDLSKIRIPSRLPRYGRERVVGEIAFPSTTRHWTDRMEEVLERRKAGQVNDK